MRLALAALVTLPALAATSTALAQGEEDCADRRAPGFVEFWPSPGAPPGVALNAPVKVRYTPGFFEGAGSALEPSDLVIVYACDTDACDDGVEVPGEVTVVGDTLVFLPDAILEPRTRYGVVASAIDDSETYSFETGSELDTEPPQVTGLSLGSAYVESACEAPDGGYRIDVYVDRATDDGPLIDIEYLAYLTRGPEVDAPELRARARQVTDEIQLPFVLDASEAVSPICVTVHAVDGVGNVDDDMEPQCFDPIQGNFFEPLCNTSELRRSHAGGWPLAVALGLIAVAARRRRR